MGVLGSFWTHHKHGYWLGYMAIFILDPHDSQWLNGSYGVGMVGGGREALTINVPNKEAYSTYLPPPVKRNLCGVIV